MFRAPGISTPDWLPIEAGGLYEARYTSGKARKILVSMVQLVQKSGFEFRDGRGHPFCTQDPLGTGEIAAHNFTLESGLPKFHNRTRELAPAVRDHNDALASVDTSSDLTSVVCCLVAICRYVRSSRSTVLPIWT